MLNLHFAYAVIKYWCFFGFGGMHVVGKRGFYTNSAVRFLNFYGWLPLGCESGPLIADLDPESLPVSWGIVALSFKLVVAMDVYLVDWMAAVMAAK